MQLYPPDITDARGACASRSRSAALALASAYLSLAAVACGGDGVLAPGVKEGTGSVTASGAVSASGSGLAFFQSISSGSTSLFQIVIVPETPTTTNVWQVQIINYSGRLGVGTYNLAPLSASSSDPTANFGYTSGATMQLFNSSSGELKITGSSRSAVRGTFTFTATSPAGGTSSVTVQGSFNAQCAPGTACQ